MTITIETKEVVFDIINKTHTEVADISDPEARYRAELGTDKADEVERALISSHASVVNILSKYLVPDMASEGLNNPGVPEYLVYELRLSERRQAGKAQPLASMIHSYLVNLTLSKCYHSVGQEKLAAAREGLASADAELIKDLLLSKQPPYLSL